MSVENHLQFRQVTARNLGRFAEMTNLCFGLKVDAGYFKWKYFDNPHGGTIAFEALDGKTVAAFYGVIPEIYLINGDPIKVYQSMDTMTHPSYQRRGLFVKLAKMTYDHIVETEGRLELVGIPGSNSYHGLVNKLGWTNIHKFTYFFLHKSIFQVKQLLRRRSNAEIKEVREITVELKSYLSERKVLSASIQPQFSPEFFDWRVFQHPYRGYQVAQIHDGNRLVGICVYAINEEKRCTVYFLDFAEDAFFAEYTSAVINFLFQSTGVGFIHTWEPLKKVLHEAYRQCGFIKNTFERGPFSYRVPLCVRSQHREVNGVDWFDINNYDVQPLMQD